MSDLGHDGTKQEFGDSGQQARDHEAELKKKPPSETYFYVDEKQQLLIAIRHDTYNRAR